MRNNKNSNIPNFIVSLCNCVMESVDNPIAENNALLFDGNGGTGKTFLSIHC